MPHNHTDMFVKFINKETVLVNQMESLNNYKGIISEGELLQNYEYGRQLDNIADELSKRFKVVRLPMPASFRELFRTYTNSLIVNKNVIVPRFEYDKTVDKLFIDIDILKKQEEIVEKIYTSLGFKVVFINSDNLIAHGGSFHCVTTSLPVNENEKI